MPWNIINSVKTVPTKNGVGGTWIATGNTPTYNTTRLAKSNNGTSWNGISYPWTNEYYFNDIAYGKDGAGNNLWVAVGIIPGAQLATSTDGTNWTKATPAAFGSGYGIAYGKDGSGVGLWVCACNGGIAPGNSIATSPDGINWTGKGRTGFTYGAKAVAYGKDNLGNGVWIAVSNQGGNNAIAISSNGNTWTTIFSRDILWTINNIRYGLNSLGIGLWIACGSGSNPNGLTYVFATSPNGTNWTGGGSTSVYGSITEVSYGKDGAGNGLWVATANNSANLIAISSNGTTWTPVTINSTIISGLKGVKYGKDDKGNGMWLAIGEGSSNTIVKSINGTNWTGVGYVFSSGTAIAFSEIIVPP
jgi:hypothetical protein